MRDMIVVAFDKPNLILSKQIKIQQLAIMRGGNQLGAVAIGLFKEPANELRCRLGMQATVNFVYENYGSAFQEQQQRQQVKESPSTVRFFKTLEKHPLLPMLKQKLTNPNLAILDIKKQRFLIVGDRRRQMYFSLVPLQDTLEIMLQLIANGRRERLDHLIVNQLLEYYLCDASIEKTQILFKSQLGVRITVKIKPVAIGVVRSNRHKTPKERPHPSRMLNQNISLGLAAIQVIECQHLRIVPSGEIILIKRKPLRI